LIRFPCRNNRLLAVADVRVEINLPIEQDLLRFCRCDPMPGQVTNVSFVPIELNGRHDLSGRLFLAFE